MNALETGPATQPSGLVIPWSPEDAARVRTTLTAQGVYKVMRFDFSFFKHSAGLILSCCHFLSKGTVKWC